MVDVCDQVQNLKTSEEWYRVDQSCDIFDPDGWRSLPDPHDYWYNEPITESEYIKRLRASSITKFMRHGHASPVTKSTILYSHPTKNNKDHV